MARIAKKPGRYHHGDLRRVLLETAGRVIEQDGLGALSLQALAHRAGVSSGAPYHHFETREHLLAAIAEQAFDLLTAELRRSTREAVDDARGYLEALARGYVRFALAHRGHFRVMFRPELKAHVTDAQRAAFGQALQLLRDAIDRCQAEGIARSADPGELVLLAWSAAHGASVLFIDNALGDVGITDGEELAAIVGRALLAAVTR